ncbi:MAG: tyrosinase family protein [Rhizomicrobium sp.]
MTVLFDVPGTSRRVFLGTAAAAAGSALLPAIAAPAAKYTRYNATSPQGRAMLVSYERGVRNLLKYDAGDSRNWFRNAFIHAMDCPHGNWWFFTWHRPFVGYFEQTVRDASGSPNFAFPYWDWTAEARIPEGMFSGALDPTSGFFNPYISTFETFFEYLNPAMTDYWKTLSPAQLAQLQTRGMPTLASLWQQVKDFEQSAMYAQTPYARYLTKANPWLDDKTKVTVSLPTILKGLAPNTFDTFNSNETPSHNTAPSGTTVFAILEGQPHNKTHNNIGGVGHIPNDQYLKFGYMADNLSPVDPVFFLHHSNMDRLWDVWTRKQQARRLPWLPTGAQFRTFATEPFLFYVDRMGKPAPRRTAGESIPIGDFDYAYQPGSGEQSVTPVAAAVAALKPFVGAVSAGAGAVSVPQNLLQGGTLVASITIPHPMSGAAPRDYDVLVNAPPGTTHVEADSPYYAGTVSFFGFMAGMMAMDVTFQVPLTRLPAAAKGKAPGDLVFTVVPSYASPNLRATALGQNGPAPLLKAVSVAVSP